MQIPRLWLRTLQSCSDDSNAFGNLGGVPTTTRVVDTYMCLPHVSTDTFLSILCVCPHLFIYFSSFNPCNSPMRQLLLLSPFYRWKWRHRNELTFLGSHRQDLTPRWPGSGLCQTQTASSKGTVALFLFSTTVSPLLRAEPSGAGDGCIHQTSKCFQIAYLTTSQGRWDHHTLHFDRVITNLRPFLSEGWD